VARVPPRHSIRTDHRARGRRLRAEIQVRLQELPHQFPPLLFQERFKITVRHVGSIR
jgi:hypothetical protein